MTSNYKKCSLIEILQISKGIFKKILFWYLGSNLLAKLKLKTSIIAFKLDQSHMLIHID